MEDVLEESPQLVNYVLREVIAKFEDIKSMGVSPEVEAEINRTIARYSANLLV